jgi:Protein of unknown function (DUF3089)
MFRILAGALSVALLFAGSVQAQPMGAPAGAPPVGQQPRVGGAPVTTGPDYGPNNYGDKADWLCWPGRADACASDLTTTVVKADGSTAAEAFQADPNAPVDCFYVYPTVSRDKAVVSDMTVKPEERNVVSQQAARLRARCRLYAPMYRQFTLTALRAAMGRQGLPGPRPPRPTIGYDDVVDAWNYYLAHENHGRGVVLVGHSQGSGVLVRLIANQIDGKPAQAHLISAILMGVPLVVPAGADVGGDFKTVPLCHSARQLGCVIAYSSFREDSPPPDNSRFGRPRAANATGMEAACVNPANLGGGTGEAKSYFGTPVVSFTSAAFPWLKDKPITTPFVSVPGLITATCAHTGQFHYLAIHVNADPASARTSTIPGDVVIAGQIQKDWGLHVIDASLFMGNLVDIVGEESKAWAAKGR